MAVSNNKEYIIEYLTPKRERSDYLTDFSSPTTNGDVNRDHLLSLKMETPESIVAPYYGGDSTPDNQKYAAVTTPVRRTPVSRTYLQDRIIASSSPPQNMNGFHSESSNPDYPAGSSVDRDKLDTGKRGRPRADLIDSLMMEGAQSGSTIKCHICSRVFPREKSLQAHLRTHTGERPYTCDYPGCTRAFTQSGQLKTHQRLHAGEKPFVCSAPGCENRYTHANRQCPDHPYAKPQRTSEIILQPNISANEDQEKVLQWLHKYKRDREEKTPAKTAGSENTAPSLPLGQPAPSPVIALAVPPPPVVVEERRSPLTASCGSPSKKLKSKRGLIKEMDLTVVNQENMPSPSFFNNSNVPTPPKDITRNTVVAQRSFNQALIRAGERLEMNENSPTAGERNASVAGKEIEGCSPFVFESSFHNQSEHVLRRNFDINSPLKSVRRTLGDITPTKNCRAADTSDLDLPFNFGILTSPTPVPVATVPQTPISSEKFSSGANGSFTLGSSGSVQGSPAIKLKKRFQERFQVENQTEDRMLAHPISWVEDSPPNRLPLRNSDPSLTSAPLARRDPTSLCDVSSPDKLGSGCWDSFSPLRIGQHLDTTNNSTLLVAAALVELHDSPTRHSQEAPLNLTKKNDS